MNVHVYNLNHCKQYVQETVTEENRLQTHILHIPEPV